MKLYKTYISSAVRPAVLLGFFHLLAYPLHATPLTQNEIDQIETELAITLTEQQKTDLAQIVKPDQPDTFHVDAESRIEQLRKANLILTVLDTDGNPVPGVEVDLELTRKKFNFGGVINLKKMVGASAMGISTNRYRELFLKFFDSCGLNNGLKAKLRAGNEAYLPEYFEWCSANNIKSRGHTLIWPGRSATNNHLPAHIRDILNDLYATATTGPGGGTIYDEQLMADLDAACDDMIIEWAGLWPVYEWDVYNEPYGNHEIQEILGYDVMFKWFQLAQTHAVSPNCGLFINDNRMVSAMSPSQYNSRTAVYRWYIEEILAANAPITGIGFQNRIKFEYNDPALLYTRLEDFAGYGLDLAGTEFHIPTNSTFNPTEYRRAEMTEEIMVAYFSHPDATGLNVWTFLESNMGNGPFLDNSGNVQLNALAWYYLNRIRYTTQTNLTTDAAGTLQLRGFIGDYDLTIHGGTTYTSTLTLDASDDQQTLLYLGNDARIDHFEALADATVAQTNPDTNYGHVPVLTLQQQTHFAYLKFDLPHPAGPFQNAKLYIYSLTDNGSVNAYAVHHGNWTEKAITWNNAPAIGTLVGTATFQESGWIGIDLTQHVTTNGTYTIALEAPALLYLGSRENNFRPYLEIMPYPDTDDDGLQNPVDTDDDGDWLPDDYELLNSLAPLDPADAQADPDLDGLITLVEFAGGTDPNQSGERGLAIAGSTTGIQLRLSERHDLSHLGLAIQLEHTRNLMTNWTIVDGFDFSTIGHTLLSAQTNTTSDSYGPIDHKTYNLDTANPDGFFRTKIVPVP